MRKAVILEKFYDDRWEFCQVINGTAEEAIIDFFNMEYDHMDRPVAFRKSEDGWTYPTEVATCDPNADKSVDEAGKYKCKGADDELCRAREVTVWTPNLGPMKPDHDVCEHCGRRGDTWRNGSGELQCDNCGWSETE